jgi:hypothetical protein
MDIRCPCEISFKKCFEAKNCAKPVENRGILNFSPQWTVPVLGRSKVKVAKRKRKPNDEIGSCRFGSSKRWN